MQVPSPFMLFLWATAGISQGNGHIGYRSKPRDKSLNNWYHQVCMYYLPDDPQNIIIHPFWIFHARVSSPKNQGPFILD